MAIEFNILGPEQAILEGERLPLGGRRQRAVLARLLLDAGRVVPVDVLIDDVWSRNPPATATLTLQKDVSQLRKSLGSSVLRTDGNGYVIDADASAIDARRFERLLTEDDFASALALWRGEVLADPGVIAAGRGDHVQGMRLFAQAVRLRYELGDYVGLSECFAGLADTLASAGRLSEAAQLLTAAEERRLAGGSVATAEETQATHNVQAVLGGATSTSPAADPMGLEEAVEFVLALDPSDRIGRSPSGTP